MVAKNLSYSISVALMAFVIICDTKKPRGKDIPLEQNEILRLRDHYQIEDWRQVFDTEIVNFCLLKPRRSSYIEPCSKSAPDFDDCCLDHGKKALPYILQGDKEYKVPSLLPFVLQSISMDSENLKFSINDAHFYGFDNNDLKKVKFDFKNKKVINKFVYHDLSITGDCNIQGKIVMLPVQSSEKCNFTFVDIDVDYLIDYRLDVKDGEEYFAIDNATCDFSCERLYINIGNIFGDNKELSDTTNKALNDNWKDYLQVVAPMIKETIIKIGYIVISGLAGAVPFEEIFLD